MEYTQTVAVLGPQGTFSDTALAKYAAHAAAHVVPCYYLSIDQVIASVGRECSLGLVPIENTLDGYVHRTLDLLLEHDVEIVLERCLPIAFAVIGNVEKLEEIEKIYVQFKANGQCRSFLSHLPKAQIITTDSNMQSFHQVEQHKNFGEAAIIPQGEMKNATAPFFLEDVTDAKHNETRFVLLSPRGAVPTSLVKSTGQLRASIVVMPPQDRPGILFAIVSIFHTHDINLVSIVSRPTKKNMGTYHFYLECLGTYAQKKSMEDALAAVAKLFPLKQLGLYFT